MFVFPILDEVRPSMHAHPQSMHGCGEAIVYISFHKLLIVRKKLFTIYVVSAVTSNQRLNITIQTVTLGPF